METPLSPADSIGAKSPASSRGGGGVDGAGGRHSSSPKRSRGIHPNNCAEVESAVQRMLAHKSSFAMAAVDDPAVVCTRDKIRIMAQPFIPSVVPFLSSASSFDAGETPASTSYTQHSLDTSDPLLSFASRTPYSSIDRHRRYRAEDTTSTHLDIQNPDRLEQTIQQFSVQPAVTLLKPYLFRGQIPADADYIALRNCQNVEWAKSSLETGLSYLKVGNLDKAMSAFSHALEIDSDCVDAMLELSKIQVDRKDFDAAFKSCERALTLNPLNDTAFDCLCHVIKVSGKTEYTKSFQFTSIETKRKEYLDCQRRTRSPSQLAHNDNHLNDNDLRRSSGPHHGHQSDKRPPQSDYYRSDRRSRGDRYSRSNRDSDDQKRYDRSRDRYRRDERRDRPPAYYDRYVASNR